MKEKAAVIFMSHCPMRPATFFTRWLSRFEILCPMLVPKTAGERNGWEKEYQGYEQKARIMGKRSRNPPLIRKGASRLTSGCVRFMILHVQKLRF